jgi:hypothetical protein
MAVYQVYFTDGTLNAHPALKGFLTGYSLHMECRDCDVDTYQVTTVATDELLALVDPDPGDPVDLRIVILRDIDGGSWEYFASGPFAAFRVSRSSDSGEDSEPGQLVITFDSDDVYAAERFTYPDTTHAFNAQGAAVRDAITVGVPAETAIKDLVNRNAGPGALAARRVPHLAIETDAGTGADVTYSTRLEPLGDVTRSLATVGGVSYRTVQVPGPGLLFTVRVPVDLTGSVVYSFGLGNLRQLAIEDVIPNATVALVGDDGTGSSRVLREVIDTAAVARHRRIERFVSNGATDSPTLDQAGRDELVTDGESTALTLAVTDNPQLVYGRDYNLSDIVGYEYAPGRLRADRVYGVTIDVGADGVESVTPTIGIGDATTDQRQVKINQRTARRLARIEGK